MRECEEEKRERKVILGVKGEGVEWMKGVLESRERVERRGHVHYAEEDQIILAQDDIKNKTRNIQSGQRVNIKNTKYLC
ncbi:hypothetical protein RI129_011956, partial [Pyrocoelia pectoralis]